MRLIAIDGPAGAGKSTVARALAARLGLRYLDTGAMYRAVAFAAIQRGIDPSDEPGQVAALATALELEVSERGVFVDGQDASIEIRGPVVTRAVSAVAANPAVRAELTARMREWAETNGGGVVEGRDIASVVFPSAELKLFVTADAAVRAERRHREVADLAYDEVAASIAARDEADAGRDHGPLVVTDGATVVDTTDRSVESIVDEIVGLLS